MKKDLENLENALDVNLWGRIISKFWLIGAMVVVAIVLSAVAMSQLNPPPKPAPPEVIDRTWFITLQNEIEALDLEIQVAQEALERHQENVKARSGFLSWSREDERVESERLNHNILELQRHRIELIRRFNTERAAYNGTEQLPEPIQVSDD